MTRKLEYVQCSTCPNEILARDLLDGTPNEVDGRPTCPTCVWEMGVSYDR